jgi:hypothetical protein
MTSQPTPQGPVQLLKGRAEWTHWAGTPGDLGDIAQLALELVQQAARDVMFVTNVSAPAFDAKFLTPDQLREGLRPDDLTELTLIEIEVDQVDMTPGPARIAVTVMRPASSGDTTSLPVVKLTVTSESRDWVDLARLRMSERLQEGARQTSRVSRLLLLTVAVLVGLALAVGLGLRDTKQGLNAAEIVGIVLGSLAGCLLLLVVSLDSITPQLELLPRGGATRWDRLKQRSKSSGRWLNRTVLTAAITAAVTVLITLLLTRL